MLVTTRVHYSGWELVVDLPLITMVNQQGSPLKSNLYPKNSSPHLPSDVTVSVRHSVGAFTQNKPSWADLNGEKAAEN